MEASMAFALETDDLALLNFIYSMWDIKTKPISAEEAGNFAQAYDLLEYIEEPESGSKVNDTTLHGFIDVIANNDPWDELVDNVVPYVESGVERAIAMVSGDEGDYWFSVTKKDGVQQIKVPKKWFKGVDQQDMFAMLLAVLTNLKR